MSPEATEPHRAGSPQQFAAFLWEIPGTVRNRLETVPGTVGIHTGTVETVDILLKEYKPLILLMISTVSTVPVRIPTVTGTVSERFPTVSGILRMK